MTLSSRSRIYTLQALVLFLFAGVFSVIVTMVFEKHQWAQNLLEENEPLYARLLGLESTSGLLLEAEKTISALLSDHAYPPEQTAVQAGNDAQQRIRAIFVASKLDIASIQVLPSKETQSFDRINVVLRVEGDLTGLQIAMIGLEGLKPIILIDSVNVQVIGPAKPKIAPRLLAQFNFSVLRLRP